MMNEKFCGPQRLQASDLQSYPSRQAPPSRARLGSSAVDIYLRLLYPLAVVGNLAVIATVPAGAIAERVAHPLSSLRKIARRDQDIAA
jgi:hypothetical protein